MQPTFETSEIDMPDEIKSDPIARGEWERRAPELVKIGILTGQDRTEFAAYCRQVSLCGRLWQKIKTMGVELAIAKGIFKAHQSSDAARLRLASRFGFTPADRNQIKITPPKKRSPADKYFPDGEEERPEEYLQ